MEKEEPIKVSDWIGMKDILFDYGLTEHQVDYLEGIISTGTFQELDDVVLYKGNNQNYYATKLRPSDDNDVLKEIEKRIREMAGDVQGENRRRDAA